MPDITGIFNSTSARPGDITNILFSSTERTSCVCNAATCLERRANSRCDQDNNCSSTDRKSRLSGFRRVVASGLVDSELNHILESIDAGTNLKRLKLTHCFKIKCRGLQPLENSRVIEQIDLSLVARNEDPSEGLPGGLISTEDVVPVLNSIIGADVMLRGSAHNHQCSLRQIQLPKKWTDNPVEELVQFLSVYNRIGITCMKCNGIEYSWINTVEIVTFRAGFLGSTS
ncbi:hypothetical protein ACHAXN_011852 [Cyclotella atomus]